MKIAVDILLKGRVAAGMGSLNSLIYATNPWNMGGHCRVINPEILESIQIMVPW